MATPLRLGLTGGIGSGKSTVAQMLRAHGAALVDADAIARQLTAAGGAAMPAVATAFGKEFVTPDGALDRDKMRALAFADPQARARLEAIVHPLVQAETLRQAAAATAPCVVLDIPLLAESTHWRGRLDRILVVDCRSETQIARVMLRNALQKETVEQIIAAQAPRLRRLAIADAVLFNDGATLDQLRAEVALLAPRFGL
ncbi:MAG: dephospho-CoA kinase [Pseudomonadota bacterium]